MRRVTLVLVVIATFSASCGNHAATVRVPRLVGLTGEDAYNRLAAAQLCPKTLDATYLSFDGTYLIGPYVIGQNPPAGTEVRRLAQVALHFAPSGPSGTVYAPAVDPSC